MNSFVMNGNESDHQEKLNFTNFSTKMFKVGCLVIMLKCYDIQFGKTNFIFNICMYFNGFTEWVDMTWQWQEWEHLLTLGYFRKQAYKKAEKNHDKSLKLLLYILPFNEITCYVSFPSFSKIYI